jgi:uncharacterized protein (TIGR00375 family)
MKFAADLHIHSHYSRATSAMMNLESLDRWAKIKGIKVMGTGDFTHPLWFGELKSQLEPAEPGLFKLRGLNGATRFLLSAEISCIYSKGGSVRKVHVVVLAPSFEAAEKINVQLGWVGNLMADGRPILGLDAKELAKIALGVSQHCLVIPGHAMTPWFGIFGSKSGFNSLQECFEELTPYIYAVETGLSADPAMLWRIPDGQRVTLISNSDAHSPQKIGREVNVFDTDVSYEAIEVAIKTKDPQKFLYTIEFFPEEGKYHFDGHRLCNVSLSPQDSKKNNNLCPVCGKPLVIGVLNRIQELATHPEGYRPEGAIPFKSLVPLQEVIADALDVMVGAKQVGIEYDNLIKAFGSEFGVLLGPSLNELQNVTQPRIAQGIVNVREGKVTAIAGYDGVYGKIKVFGAGAEPIEAPAVQQKKLF